MAVVVGVRAAAEPRGVGNVSSEISSAERRKVTSAIKKAEKATSGEIVVIAARQSDDYIHVPLHIATAMALAVPLILPLVSGLFPWSSFPISWVFLSQLLVFIVAAVILGLAPLRYALTPKRLMRKYAHRYAAAQFLAVNLHGTGGRTGVLIFVSLLERHCEVIADIAIAKQVSHRSWQEIIDAMLPLLRAGHTADALVLAVSRCGIILAEHFPPGAPNPNELPDHFIVLE
jgi:putative membrane protein